MNELAPFTSTLSLTAKDRVLVAEGDAVSRRSICTSLVENGFDVVEAQNSSEVLLMNSLHLSSLALSIPMGWEATVLILFG